MESGSLQPPEPRRSGRGGTEYTTKERLLAWRQDVQMGLASRHERSDKKTADRVRRQTSTSAVLYPRLGERWRRPDPTVATDVFVRPKDKTMNETRDAMHLLVCYKWVECARNAFAINISPDAKALGRFPALGLGVDVDCYTVVVRRGKRRFFWQLP